MTAQIRLDVEGDAKIMGRILPAFSPADSSVYIGYHAGINSNETDKRNVFIGTWSGHANTAGWANTFLGHRSGQVNTMGVANTFLGYQSGHANTTGVRNTYIGFNSGRYTNGDDNTVMGYSASGGFNAHANTCIGAHAGEFNLEGTNNTYIGFLAGSLNHGSRNTFIGTNSGVVFNAGGAEVVDKSIAIGTNARVECSNCAVIGGIDEYAVNVGIGMKNPETALHVKGDENDGTTATLKLINSTGQTLLADGNEIDSNADFHLNWNSDTDITIARGGGNVTVGGAKQGTGHQLEVVGSAAKNTGGTTWSTFSDRRLKQNIEPFTKGLETILRIKPVTFKYNGRFNTSTTEQQVGVIAQDIQKVAPYMVHSFKHQESNGRQEEYLMYNSNALFYLIVNAIKSIYQKEQTLAQQQKEQAKINRTLKRENKQLNARLSDLESQLTVLTTQMETLQQTINPNNTQEKYQVTLHQKAHLSQNQPNPFNDITTINFFVPSNVQNAVIQISNIEGKVIETVPIQSTGKGELTIEHKNYPRGSYFYSLINDGVVSDTKKMVLTY